MKKFFLLKCVVLLFLLLVAGCGGEKHGAGIDPNAPKVTVRDVFFDRSLYNTLVNLEGTILSQCGSPDKCWYFMEDDTGRILVDMRPAGFALPAAIGKTARVTGTIKSGRDGYKILAQGVEIL